MKSVKSGFVGEGLCSTLNDYERLRNKLEIPDPGIYVWHETRAHSTEGFSADTKLMHRLLVISGESDKE